MAIYSDIWYDETRVENEEELFSTIPLDNITSNEYIFREKQEC